MFHLFGIMHTQMRKDRDEHITVLRQNIQRGVGSLEYNVRIGLILIYVLIYRVPINYRLNIWFNGITIDFSFKIE